MTPPPTPGALAVREHGAAALAVFAVALGMAPVVSGLAWLFDTVVAVGVVAATGALLGQGASRPLRVAGAQGLALVVTLAVLHAPAQAVGGLLPGPAAWREAAALVEEGVGVVRDQAAPVDGTPGMRLLVSAGAGLLALLVDAVAVGVRRPALAGLPLLAVHAVAVVFAPGGLGAGWFLVALAGYLLLLVAVGDGARGWGVLVAARPAPGSGPGIAAGARRPGLAALSVLAAVLAALVVPGAVDLRGRPGLLPGGVGSGLGGSTFLNPLLDLREDLGPRQDAPVLSYSTDQASPEPLRTVTVDTFTGDVWQPGDFDGAVALEPGAPLPLAPGTGSGTAATIQRTTITIAGLAQQWLPLPYPATAVDVEGEWLVDPDTLNVIAVGGERTAQGQQYAVTHLQVAPDDAQLAAAPVPQRELVERYTQLPRDLPPQIAQRAQEVTAGQTTAYGRAVALQDWFRADGGFRYTLDAPEAETGSALADFLEEKEGYCVHFASTMAVMARTLGIPARVAVGFLPGRQEADGTWQVTIGDAHAWPELYFEGSGWLRFEPTPGIRTGEAPEWTVEDAEGPGTSAPSVTPSAATSAPAPTRVDREAEEQAASGGAEGSTTSLRTVGLLGLGVGAVGAALLLPRAVRGAASRRRWRRAAGSAARAEAAWADLVERVGDLGVEVAASATPRQVRTRLEALLAVVPDQGPDAPLPPRDAAAAARLRRLAAAVEGSRYGSGAPGGVGGPGADAGVGAVTGGGGLAVLERPTGTRRSDRPGSDGRGSSGRGSDGLRADALTVVAAVARRSAPWSVRAERWWPASGRRVVRSWSGRTVAGLVRRRHRG